MSNRRFDSKKTRVWYDVNRMHTLLDSRWKHPQDWSPFHASHIFYPSACFCELLLYGNLTAAHDGINAHARNHCRRLLVASAFLLCVVRRPLFQPMPGGHRGVQPVLRPGALVHVNETASAGVLALCRACRSVTTLWLRVDIHTPPRLLAAADAPSPDPKDGGSTRVPRLRARAVTWRRGASSELSRP